MDKKTFVEGIFAEFAIALERGITSLEYAKTDYEEIVTIYYKNDTCKRVNITGDSRLGIADDVISKIE